MRFYLQYTDSSRGNKTEPYERMGEVKVTKGSSLKQSGGQTEGMIRMNALTDVSDQICGTCECLPSSLHVQY